MGTKPRFGKTVKAKPKTDVTAVVVVEKQLILAGITSIIVGGIQNARVVACAANHADIMQLVSRSRPKMVILDADLSGFGVVGLCRELKELYPDVKILLLISAETSTNCLLETLHDGVFAYILKTASVDHFLMVIRSLLHGEPIICPELAHRLARELRSSQSGISSVKKEFEPLSTREMEILKLASQGLSNKKIGEKLFISERTVQSHIAAIFRKYKVTSRTEAVLFAFSHGWIDYEKPC